MCVCMYVCSSDFFFKYDIPCSFAVNTVHFTPHGDERGHEDELKVVPPTGNY